MKVAIIDDEQSGRDVIKSFLTSFCHDIELCGEADSVKSGVKLITKTNPDVVFLDIQMQDGTGFNLLEMLPQRTFKVVFCTSFDQYALKAIKYSAADYLLKPIDPDLFIETVDKLQADVSKKRSDNRIDELLSNINSFEKIGLPVGDGIQFVKVDDIIRCEADGVYTRFSVMGGNNYLVSKNLKTYEELFADRGFIRVHKSHLINTRHIDKYNNSGGDGGSVVMADGSTVEVSRRKKDELLGMMM